METFAVIVIVGTAAIYLAARLLRYTQPRTPGGGSTCAGCSGTCSDLVSPGAGTVRCSDAQLPRAHHRRLPILTPPPGNKEPTP